MRKIMRKIEKKKKKKIENVGEKSEKLEKSGNEKTTLREKTLSRNSYHLKFMLKVNYKQKIRNLPIITMMRG